jgi:hypothetical protein
MNFVFSMPFAKLMLKQIVSSQKRFIPINFDVSCGAAADDDDNG